MATAWEPAGNLRGPQGEQGETGPPGVDAPLLAGVVDVKAAGAVGDGVADDTAALQAAIETSPQGAVLWFPPGTYLVSETIRLVPGRSYLGAGGRAMLSQIKAAPALTGGALLAARGWWDNATLCDNPIRVEGLDLDLSSVTDAHGLVVYNFWSHVEDVQVGYVDGPDACGILATDVGRDGVTVTTNSHSENTFVRCRFLEYTGRATGFRSESSNGLSNQDGHLLDGFYAGISGDAIRITRAAGWSIENNHLYGIGYNGIALTNCYATKVQRNYVEDFGGADGANNGEVPTFGYFNGIAFETVLDTRASILAHNTVSVLQPDPPAGNRWVCYSARAGAEQMLANLVVDGNTAVWAAMTGPTESRSHAWRLGEPGDTGRLLAVEWSANQIQDVPWWQQRRVVDETTVALSEPGGDAGPVTSDRMPAVPTSIRVGSTLNQLTSDAADGGSGYPANIANIAVTGDSTLMAPTNPTDGQIMRYRFRADGANRSITFGGGIVGSTGLTLGPYPIPRGKVLVCALEYVATRRTAADVAAPAWVLTAATVSG